MALINCQECKKQISDRAVSCPSCGCPADKTPLNDPTTQSKGTTTANHATPASDSKNNVSAWPSNTTYWEQNDKKTKRSGFLIPFIIVLVCLFGLYKIASTSIDADHVPSTSDTYNQEEDDSYLTGKFATMNQCIAGANNYLEPKGLKYKINSDKPKNVSASILTQEGNEIEGINNSFNSTREESGTEGIYYELFLFLPPEYRNK